MTEKSSVVTPERFASGMTYEEYVRSIERDRDKFDYNYAQTTIADDDVRALRDLFARENGPARVLALAEDWCTDCHRGLPVMARIAEATSIELRVFSRDSNPDIMDEFLKDGQHRSIPTFVFYTRDHRFIANWSERPALANEQIHLLLKIFAGKSQEEARPEYQRFQQGEVWANWRRETVREIRDLLTSACS